MHSANTPSSVFSIDTKEILGEGAYAIVYAGTYQKNEEKKPIAAKVIQRNENINEVKQLILQELTVYRDLSNAREAYPNDENANHLLAIYGFIASVRINSDDLPVFFLECMNAGDLQSWAFSDEENQKNCKTQLPYKIETVYRIALHIACALEFLHERMNYLHRDIKPANVLLHDVNGELHGKLGDFGFATNRASPPSGSPVYLAPELFKKSPANSRQTDLYAFGILLYEVIVRHSIYLSYEFSFETLSHHVTAGKRDLIPSTTPVKLSATIHNLWHQSSNQRFSARQVANLFRQPMSDIPEELKSYVPSF